MWSDKDIDKAFQRLNPPEPDPAPFPLDAWLRLESDLDKAVIARAVRRKLWRFFAAEVAVVALGWLLWHTISHSLGRNQATAPTMTAGRARTATKAAILPALPTKRQSIIRTAPAAVGSAVPLTASAAASVAKRPSSSSSDSEEKTAPAAVGAAADAAAAAAGAQPLYAVATPDTRRTKRRENSRGHGTARATAGLASAGQPTHAAPPGAYAATGYTPRHRAALTEAAASSSATAKALNAGRRGATATRLVNTESVCGAARGSQFRGAHQHNGRDLVAIIRPAGAAKTDGTSQMATAASANLPASLPTNLPASEAAAAPAAGIATLAMRAVTFEPLAISKLPNPLATVAIADAAAEPVAAPPARQPRLYLGLVAAPDVSTVKFAGVGQPLLNAGLTLEYQVTKRLRLGTGVLRATKQYVARREDYDWGAYAGRVYQRNFTDVEGACTVLDVPLNLRYDMLAQPRYKVFGSAGLSSFFMQRERYSYAYVENNLPQLWKKEAVNENRHLFSIVNLSVGYERSITPHWGLQAEPYLKIPLGGVGVGKVRLTSGGVFFGIKYGF